MHKLRATTYIRRVNSLQGNASIDGILGHGGSSKANLSKNLLESATYHGTAQTKDSGIPTHVARQLKKNSGQRSKLLSEFSLLLFYMKSYLAWLYLAFPVLIYAWWTAGSPVTQFWTAFLVMIPMASSLGDLTEELATHTGDLIGGLVNATLGNAVEMIMTIACLRRGLLNVVTGQLLGSILSNLLLVLGCSFLAGGCRYYIQRFNAQGAQCSTSLLMVACLGFIAPTLLNSDHSSAEDVLTASRMVALVIGATYVLFLVFQLWTHLDLFCEEFDANDEEDEDREEGLSFEFTMCALAGFTLVIALVSEILVGSIEEVSKTCNIPKGFIGVILLPIVGNAAEHATAVVVAMKNKPDLTMGVAVGSSTQIAMFMVPFAVLVGWGMGVPMSLAISPISCIILFISVVIVIGVVQDGESNWLEGVVLLVAYIIIAIVYWFDAPITSIKLPEPISIS